MRRGLALMAAVALVTGSAAGGADQAQRSIGDRLASESAAVRQAALAEALAAPEALDPFAYAYLAGTLWRQGDRLQAAFWFYLWQARTRPWADVDRDPSAVPALRPSIGAVLGEPINAWLGSDLAAWQDVARRAISYEARLPLYAGRPDGVDAARWQAAVAKARQDYRDGFEKTLAKADPKVVAEARRANGLYVGPLRDPGAPLRDDWR